MGREGGSGQRRDCVDEMGIVCEGDGVLDQCEYGVKELRKGREGGHLSQTVTGKLMCRNVLCSICHI